MDAGQLEALVAVIDHGSFDAAADTLHLTPSAISQRIKALESSTGQILIRRTNPATATEAGEVLLRVGRQLQLLTQDARVALGETVHNRPLTVGVNADSLATWFAKVVSAAADWPDTALQLYVEDQEHTSSLLRSAAAMGAVTANPVPVQGCSVIRLGTMRYLPLAHPRLRERYGRGRGVDWQRMPCVHYDSKDRLQDTVLAGHGVERPDVVHRVPSSEGFLRAVEAGLGWGMVPTTQARAQLTDGRLVRLNTKDHIDVELHWQVWRLDSPQLARLTDAVLTAAHSSLSRTTG